MQLYECNKHNYLFTQLIFPRVLIPCENQGVIKTLSNSLHLPFYFFSLSILDSWLSKFS
jgi:hypothetical protein